MKPKTILSLVVFAMVAATVTSVGFRRREPDSKKNETEQPPKNTTDSTPETPNSTKLDAPQINVTTTTTANVTETPSKNETNATTPANTAATTNTTSTVASADAANETNATNAAETSTTNATEAASENATNTTDTANTTSTAAAAPANATNTTATADAAGAAGAAALAEGAGPGDPDSPLTAEGPGGDPAPDTPALPSANLLLLVELLIAPSYLDKVLIIQNKSSWIFDFFNQSNVTYTGPAGYTVEANRYNFPTLFLNLFSMTMSAGVTVIDPCGLHTPHFHLRGNEIAIAIQGSFYTGFIAENGAPLVINLLRVGQMTIFGRGSIHWMANLECAPAMYLSGYNDDSPGTSNVAQNFFGFPEDITSPSLGRLDPAYIDFLAQHIPQNITQGLVACMASCGCR